MADRPKQIANPQYALLADEEYERQTLGCLLTSRYDASEFIPMINPDSFYNAKYKAIFEGMARIVEAKEELDFLKLNEQLPNMQAAGVTIADITNLDKDDDSHDLLGLIKRIEDLRLRREIQIIAFELVRVTQDRLNDIQRESEIFSRKIQKAAEGTAHDYVSLAESTNRLLEDFGQPHTGLLTGFSALDKVGGLPLCGMTVIGAGTSQGKSAFAMCLALNAARNNHNVAYISLEMSAQDLTERALSITSGVSCSVIHSNVTTNLIDESLIRDAGMEIVTGLGSRIIMEENRSTTLEQIKQSIRRLNHNRKVDVAIVDYLQIMSIQQTKRNESTEQMLALAARELHNLAMDCQMSIIVISQLNRDREDSEPQLSRLRDSSQIADAADSVLLIYRPEQYHKYYSGIHKDFDPHHTALVKMAKNRQGPTVEFVCGFEPQFTLFHDLENPVKLAASKNSDSYFS